MDDIVADGAGPADKGRFEQDRPAADQHRPAAEPD
jgi:hypothetical protein